jgi:uncharacterized tellurite resistance protein B-like protein
MSELAIILAVLAAVAFTGLYWRYRLRPETQWSLRVSRRVKELKGRLDFLLHPPANQRSAAERLAEELFDQQKRAVSVEALQRYDGIGPKIVEMLTNNDIRTLVDAEAHANAFLLFKKKIANVGEVREGLIADATKKCVAEERQSFDERRSEQGQEYQRRLAAMSADEQQQAAIKARERVGIEQCLARMSELETLANQVTFFNSLFGKVTGIDAALMARELPAVEISAAPASEPPTSSKSVPPATEISGLAHLQACCRFALLAAKADGRIAQAERATIRRVLGDQFGSDPVLLRHLDPQLEQAEANLPEEGDAFRAIKALAPQEERLTLYRFAEQIIDTAGDRNEKETQFLTRLAAAFEINPATAPAPPEPAKEAKPAGADPLEVLGIPAKMEITAELVRRRFRLLTDQYDPEKAKALGPEFAAMAEAKRAAVKAAAEKLLAPLCVPLDAPTAAPEPKELRHSPTLDDIFGA